MSINNKFNIDEQYKAYLTRCKLDEKTMSTIQKKETKRAFIAGFMYCMLLFQDEVANLEENVALEGLQKLETQIKEFWEIQSN